MNPALPDNLDELMSRFADVDPRVRDFYRAFLSKDDANHGVDYVASLSASLHRKGENLMALLVIDRSCDEQTMVSELSAGRMRALLLTRIKVLHALHSYDRARSLAEQAMAVATGPDVELVGNLASIIKSQAMSCADHKRRVELMRVALDLYATVFTEAQFRGSYWLGVNALALALCLGDFGFVRQHLATVRADCGRSVEQAEAADFWTLATLAELSLIDLISSAAISPGAVDSMLDAYGRADQACESLQQRKSARKNLGILLGSAAAENPALPEGLAQRLDQRFRPASVVVFSGHRVDEPGRTAPRFPASSVSSFRQALAAHLGSHPVDVGLASAANGGDLLFLDALLAAGNQVNVVLPFDEHQFADASVGADMDSAHCDWQQQYRALLAGERDNAVIWHASHSEVDAGIADAYYAHANQVLFGLARLKAREIGGECSGLVLADAQGADSGVGALAAGQQWAAQGLSVKAWSPSTQQWCALVNNDRHSRPSVESGAAVNRTMLFADVMGFSRFGERAMAGFCDGFLGCVRDLLDAGAFAPEETNTWGDGLFLVFTSASEAAEFALQLCETMVERNHAGSWQRYGLPREMSVRVSLHSSPVRRFINPLTGVNSHWGHNVNIAARIEPITPPNQVYGSVSTAALLAAESGDNYAADFVGMVPLAKNFGTLEIFRIWRGA